MGHRKIATEVKDEAVHQVVVEGRSVSAVCAMTGVGPTALRRWVQQWRAVHEAVPLDVDEAAAQKQRIVELETLVGRLRGERDLLKKSIAFFVRENDRSAR
jgi:transposase